MSYMFGMFAKRSQRFQFQEPKSAQIRLFGCLHTFIFTQHHKKNKIKLIFHNYVVLLVPKELDIQSYTYAVALDAYQWYKT